MSHQYRIPDKLQKLRKHRLNLRRLHHHGIGNAGKLGNFKWNRNFRIHKGTEFVRNPSILHLHSSNFNNLILNRTKACGLQVKHHESPIQFLALLVDGNILQVIHQISLHSVNNLKRIVLIQRLYVMVGIRESLHHSVVSNGNGLVPPVMSAFYDGFYIRYPIHITHFCMTVKLHPLFRRSVLPGNGKIRYLSDSCNRADG